MRVNVLQTWTAASLVLVAVLMAGTGTPRLSGASEGEARRVLSSVLRVPHCAAPSGLLSDRRPGAVSRHEGAAILLVLLGQRARLGGPSR